MQNELYLSVFGKVVVDEPMPVPSFNCKEQTRQLGAFTAPGLSVDYTVRWAA